ncbi:MAG: metallophosphoesterase [Myxococcota bacterium]|nr:metallophosphoesterase [Myxococcota bacterium]
MARATSEPQHVFVGDVQGCADEFDELLARLQAEFGGEFFLHSVGDLVNRGPDNLRVLERMRELENAGRGRHVLGNHDLGLIAALLGIRPLGERDTLGDVLASSDAEGWLEWLRGRPLAEKGEIGGEVFLMVHASVHPDWAPDDCIEAAARVEARLRADDRDSVCRFLEESAEDAAPGSDRDLLGRLVSCRGVRGESWASRYPEGSDAEPWHRAWRARRHAYGVVYGHWAAQGLHLAPGLRGLDTGCVHHGRGRDGYLTAWLPDAAGDPAGVPPFRVDEPTLWQIPARRRYYPY